MKSGIVKQIIGMAASGAMAFGLHAQSLMPSPQYVPMYPGSPPPQNALWSDTLLVDQGNIPFSLVFNENPNEGAILVIPTINGAPIPGNPALLASPTVWMDSFDPNGGVVSDIIASIPDPLNANNGLVLALWSDSDAFPVYLNQIRPNLPPNAMVLPEPNGLVDISQYVLPGFTAEFQSAPDNGATAPLMAMGLITLCGVSRLLRARI